MEPRKPEAADNAFPLFLARCVWAAWCVFGGYRFELEMGAVHRKHMAFDAPTPFLDSWKRRQTKQIGCVWRGMSEVCCLCQSVCHLLYLGRVTTEGSLKKCVVGGPVGSFFSVLLEKYGIFGRVDASSIDERSAAGFQDPVLGFETSESKK